MARGAAGFRCACEIDKGCMLLIFGLNLAWKFTIESNGKTIMLILASWPSCMAHPGDLVLSPDRKLANQRTERSFDQAVHRTPLKNNFLSTIGIPSPL